MLPHDRAQREEVGWAAGRRIEDGGDLAEVLGTEDPRCHDRECLCVEVMRVVELVDSASWNAERLARAATDRCAPEDSVGIRATAHARAAT